MACGSPIPHCYVLSPSTKYLLIITTVVLIFVTCSCGAPAANNRSCSHDEYAIFSNATFITCRECPPCVIGTGLIKPCGTDIDIKDDIDCKPCPNGTYNDHDLPKVVMCKACNIQENKEVIKTCTSERNTEYGACIKGFYHREGEDECVECSCCISGSHNDFVKKCIDDGLPVNMQCKQSGQLCPVISTTQSTTTTASTSQITQSPLPEAVPNGNIHESGTVEDNQQPDSSGGSYWAFFAFIIPITIIGVVVGVFVKRRRRTSCSAGALSTEMKEMTGNPEQHTPLINGPNYSQWTSMEIIFEQERSATPELETPSISSDPSTSGHTSIEYLAEKGQFGNGKVNPSDDHNTEGIQWPQQIPGQSGNGEVVTPADDHPGPSDIHNNEGIEWARLIPDCRLSKMPFALNVFLCLELDIKKAYKASCHAVGKAFKLTQDQLKGLVIADQQAGCSPTEYLFSVLETRGSEEPSVKDLVKVLIELQRSDIVDKWDWEANKEKDIT